MEITFAHKIEEHEWCPNGVYLGMVNLTAHIRAWPGDWEVVDWTTDDTPGLGAGRSVSELSSKHGGVWRDLLAECGRIENADWFHDTINERIPHEKNQAGVSWPSSNAEHRLTAKEML